jgi:hypothetical protein
VVGVIVVGLLLLVRGEAKFDATGFALVMTAACMSGLRFSLTQARARGAAAGGRAGGRGVRGGGGGRGGACVAQGSGGANCAERSQRADGGGRAPL